ncbi:glycosyltransferase family 4 protein [Halovulum dunhuangense]|uniref:Glycosyltransferase family 4 protein n=1 Tax=Halovulum dunhuangense TaxID=1505036 RepID=A0A849KX37_9RHOB|nr:glycosyltransferase family 1 protein [Halovulum dunhuangense]NNU78977.1 glycosyltransferase family 4 protein [Halovulum dunhuangense]
MRTGPQDIVLDVTRSLSRIGAGGDSGVDRVERAYIRHLMGLDGRVFFLTRVLRGAALLDRIGMARLLELAADPTHLPAPDLLGHLARRQNPARRRAESAARRLALGWATTQRLPGLLARHLSKGFAYINVGHTHLEPDHLIRLRAAGAGRIAVMVHDVIPLDYPEFSRPGTPAKFERLLRGVAANADIVIFNSADTATRAGRWFDRWGMSPATVTALLGVDPADPTPTAPAAHPHFVVLGTIEPRKNHLLLLNIWRRMHDTMPEADIPHLHIVGRRGWENENILDMLDRAPFMGRTVFEHGYLPDPDMNRLLGGARALLFPSFAEGFGYPLAEALQMGVPAICADLPVYREIVGDAATYLDPLDAPAWLAAISDFSALIQPNSISSLKIPFWDQHFSIVCEVLCVSGDPSVGKLDGCGPAS